MSTTFDNIGEIFVNQLKQTAGKTWEKIPDSHKKLAARTAVKWALLHVSEALGQDVTMQAREVDAIFAVLEDEVAQAIRNAILEFVGATGIILGKVALSVLKGAIPGISAILP